MSRRPTLRSSISSDSVMLVISFSRSALISSMGIVAMTTRICPKMMSRDRFSTSARLRPRRRSAAFCITPGSVETPTVNVAGVFTLMFCCERAPCSLISMGIGVRSRKA